MIYLFRKSLGTMRLFRNLFLNLDKTDFDQLVSKIYLKLL